MKPRVLRERVYMLGAVDWNRRLFDSLIPLPDGTSYNAYLVQGSEKTALLDTVDPPFEEALLFQLSGVDRIDYIVSHHTEQDHSGSIPVILNKYPQARVICSSKAASMLVDHLGIPADRIQPVGDGESISLGDKTLRFYSTPWVHWPETIVTHLPEDRILFTCDLFGSHLATSNLYASSEPTLVIEEAKRYYAEIMMPYRKIVARNLEKIRPLEFDLIAPSHGPVYDNPEAILAAYEDWVSPRLANQVILPYISMHGSTEKMVDHLIYALSERDVEVKPFELSVADIGRLAIALVDAATLVIGTPTVINALHPAIASAAHLVNILKPKLRYAALVGSYGWSTKVTDQLVSFIPNLEVELLGTVLCKGAPRAEDYAALDALADAIRLKHNSLPTAAG